MTYQRLRHWSTGLGTGGHLGPSKPSPGPQASLRRLSRPLALTSTGIQFSVVIRGTHSVPDSRFPEQRPDSESTPPGRTSLGL